MSTSLTKDMMSVLNEDVPVKESQRKKTKRPPRNGKTKNLRKEILTKTQKTAIAKASARKIDEDEDGVITVPRASTLNRIAMPPRANDLKLFLPKSPPGWAPWSNHMPAVQEHYRQHFADYTGVKMFHERNLPYKLNELLGTSPIVFTIAVLYGETWNDRAVFKLPRESLMWLKSYVYEAINRSLLAARGDTITVDLITHVRCISGFEACFDPNFESCRHHLRGAKILLKLFNGPHYYNYYDRNYKALIWQDRAICHVAGDDNFVWDRPKDAYWNPSSPLFLATVPSETQLGRAQFQRMLVCSHMTPGTEIITLLYRLQEALRTYFEPDGEQAAKQQILDGVEMEFLRRTPDNYRMVLIYTDPQYKAQIEACEALRRGGLLLISAARHRKLQTMVMSAKLDYATNNIFMLDMKKLADHSLHCALWTLFIAAPYATSYVRRMAIQHTLSVATQLRLESWNDIRQQLLKLLYYPEIHDDTGPAFWEECQKSRSSNQLPERSVVVAETRSPSG